VKAMKFLSVPILFIAVFISLAVFMPGMGQLPSVKPAPFEWALFESETANAGPFFAMEFEDGRFYCFRAQTISQAKVFPIGWAENLNLSHPFMELQCGAKTTRIDIPDTEAGRSLLVTFLNAGEPLKQSDNWKNNDGQN
jgi:hypothetical protein